MTGVKRSMMMAAGSAGGADPLYVEDVFSTYVFTANGQTGQTITNGIDLSGEGGMVWHKDRAATYGHVVWDTERGDSVILSTNADTGNTTKTMTGDGTGQIAFKANGYDLKWDTGNEGTNKTVGWTFRKAPGFFDVVTYSGNGSNRTIAHNLESTPGFIIVKRTNGAEDWTCYQQDLGATKYIQINGTGAADTETTIWNDTAPTSSVFTVGTHARTNNSGYDYVAYLFAHDAQEFGADSDESIIKCGSYTTDGSGDASVTLGWEPQWVLDKTSSYGAAWSIVDMIRGFDTKQSNGYQQAAILAPDSSNAESMSGGEARVNATGFSVTGTTASQTFIYMAIRRPMKTPEAGTEVFKPQTRTGSGAEVVTGAGFVPDVFYNFDASNGGSNGLFDRLRGRSILQTHSAATENTTSPSTYDLVGFDKMDGVELGGAYNINMTGSGRTFLDLFFKRAPGFMDVVAWTGASGTLNSVAHGLGVVPELVIVKYSRAADSWYVYTSATGYMVLDTAGGVVGTTNYMASTTASVLNVTGLVSNPAYNPVAYLFATLDGVSKVGTYTADTTVTTIDCGFSAGARFILIKKRGSGNWYVWDSVRGIVSGNDPYVLTNDSAAQVTNTDWIDPHNSGFQITDEAGSVSNGVNIDTEDYIFLAIAQGLNYERIQNQRKRRN